MKTPVPALSVAVVLCWLPICPAQELLPTLSGYVLSAGKDSFRVEDRTVTCSDARTLTILESAPGMARADHLAVHICQPWTIGRRLKVWGMRNKATGVVAADKIMVDDEWVETVAGYALIDRVLQPETAGSITIRADGHVLRATPKTKLNTPDTAVRSLAAVSTNMWARYKGSSQPDSSVLVTELLVTPNHIAKVESKLRENTQFDAAAVKEQDRQSGVNKFFLGLNSKKIPSYDDAAMQARITRIGESLIPAYQKALPADDPSRIDFTFQLVNLDKGPEAIALPSGIILVPYQILDMLNDAQLAAVLATNIGTVLQKQDLRYLPTGHALTATYLAGLAGGLFVPGLGLATGIGTKLKESAVLKAAREQDQRVGMCLLHDAGYDLTEAPMAWWRLHSNPKKAIPNGAMPPAAAYAYHLLGTVWRGTLNTDVAQSGH